MSLLPSTTLTFILVISIHSGVILKILYLYCLSIELINFFILLKNIGLLESRVSYSPHVVSLELLHSTRKAPKASTQWDGRTRRTSFWRENSVTNVGGTRCTLSLKIRASPPRQQKVQYSGPLIKSSQRRRSIWRTEHLMLGLIRFTHIMCYWGHPIS